MNKDYKLTKQQVSLSTTRTQLSGTTVGIVQLQRTAGTLWPPLHDALWLAKK